MEAVALQILKALSDETRLRIVGLLRQEPLTVSELLQVLEMGQSRVSRHLKILTDAHILEGSREGSHIYYGLNSKIRRNHFIHNMLHSLGIMDVSDADFGGMFQKHYPDELDGDLHRLDSVLDARKTKNLQYFQQYGYEQEQQQQGIVDASYYRRKILNLLPDRPGITVDLGSGIGELSRLLVGVVDHLICVDQSENLLKRARNMVGKEHAEFRLGELEKLPIRDAEADTVIASMVLHHIPEPMMALKEARRILRPGGSLIIAELEHHGVEDMRARFSDFWLGFETDRLAETVEQSGFRMERKGSGKGQGRLKCLFIRAKAA